MKKQKIISFLVYAIIVAIPFSVYLKKNSAYRKYMDIGFAINGIPDTNNQDLIAAYCDTVNLFLQEHPIKTHPNLNCDDFITGETSKGDFREAMLEIFDEYRKQKNKAMRVMFGIMIIATISLEVSRKFFSKEITNT